MIIPVLKTRTEKPPLGTPLRADGHWSVQGLVGCVPGNEGAGASITDILNGAKFTAYSAGQPGQWSEGNASTDGTIAYRCTAIPATLQNLPDSTCVMAVNRKTQSNYQGVLGYDTSGSCILKWNGSAITFIRKLSTTNAQANWNPGGTTTGIHTLVGTLAGGVTPALFFDGKLAPATITTGVGSLNEPATMFILGNNSNFVGSLLLSLTYNRVLSALEIASLSANPWQVYEPEVVWVEVGGAGTSTISSDLSVLWDNFSQVSSSVSTLWDVFSQISSSLSIKWDILNQISSDLAIRFSLLNSLFSDLSIKWDVFSQVNGDLVVVFDTRGLTNSDLSLIWNAAGTVFSDLTVKWDLGDLGGKITIIGSSFRRFIQ